MNISGILDSYEPYKKLVDEIDKTPVSISGLEESAQVHLVHSLVEKFNNSALVICYSDMEAMGSAEILKAMGADIRRENGVVTVKKSQHRTNQHLQDMFSRDGIRQKHVQERPFLIYRTVETVLK